MCWPVNQITLKKNQVTEPPPPSENTVSLAAPEPIPTLHIPNIQTVLLSALLTLGVLAACRAMSEILLPIIAAFMFKMVLEPVMRILEQARIPRAIGAILVIFLLLSSMLGLGLVLSTPASQWASKIPYGLPTLQERLEFVKKPISGLQNILQHAEKLTLGPSKKPMTVAVEGSALSDQLITETRAFISGAFAMILVLFFLLIAGDTFLRRLVEILPRFRDKKHAVEISQQTERDISVYLATITVMNACVGFATGIVMTLCNIEDPILWGAIAFLLNYVFIIGPLMGVTLFALVGLLTQATLPMALLPAGLYLIIHICEATYITPMLLAKRFTLNPVIVILAFIFWYWMWGVLGAILSTPMLATTKLICDRINVLKPLGHFLEGDSRRSAETPLAV